MKNKTKARNCDSYIYFVESKKCFTHLKKEGYEFQSMRTGLNYIISTKLDSKNTSEKKNTSRYGLQLTPMLRKILWRKFSLFRHWNFWISSDSVTIIISSMKTYWMHNRWRLWLLCGCLQIFDLLICIFMYVLFLYRVARCPLARAIILSLITLTYILIRSCTRHAGGLSHLLLVLRLWWEIDRRRLVYHGASIIQACFFKLSSMIYVWGKHLVAYNF